LGLREPVARVTLAEANEQRDWRLWQDLATGLIKRARRLYAGEDYSGHPHVQTPVLDEMARTGLRLDRFYAGSAVCSPMGQHAAGATRDAALHRPPRGFDRHRSRPQ
ncbi:MAG: hypothetical protein ACKOFH_11165, partial [Chthoniobacterales bacterium]